MNREEIVARLRHTMKTSCPERVQWDAVTEAARIDALGFDSLSILDLLYDLQQEFHVEFEMEELAGIATVGDLVSFMQGRLPP